MVFVYDISDASTYGLVEKQISAVHLFLSNFYRQFPDTPKKAITLVGNKVDIKRREVSERDGHRLAEEHGATFWETSVLEVDGFKDVCIRLLREMGAGRHTPSCATENSTTAIKQPQANWRESILRAWQWVPSWVCGIGKD